MANQVYKQIFSTAGSFSFAIPQYGTLTVEVVGAGGGGGGGSDGISDGISGTAGSGSTFNVNISGGGGAFGLFGTASGIPGSGGAGGNPSGGDTNRTGGAGGTGNGASGGTAGTNPDGFGGGGAGGVSLGASDGGGGGAGGEATKTYTWPPRPGETTDNFLPPGKAVSIVVGALGAAGPPNGNAGANGIVIITWSLPNILGVARQEFFISNPPAGTGIGTVPIQQFGARQFRNQVIAY